MLSLKLEVFLNQAIRKINKLSYEYLTLEVLLLTMMDDEHVLDVIKKCGGKAEEIKGELENFLHDKNNFSVLTKEQVVALGNKHFPDKDMQNLAFTNGVYYQPEIAEGLQRVIQRAALQNKWTGKTNIRGSHLLVAIFYEKESFALYVLEKQGVSKIAALKEVTAEVQRGSDLIDFKERIKNVQVEKGREDEDDREEDIVDSILSQHAVDLNSTAREGKIDTLIGRKDEILSIIQSLSRRRKNNPLLVGDAGVGKTAIVEGLAKLIYENDVPDVILKTTIYSLDIVSLLAGAKFRGDFEQRFKDIINVLSKKESKGERSILFIDEIHTLIGAGTTGTGSLDASHLLKPILSGGGIKIIGCTTHDEYRKFVEKNSGFARRFQKIDIEAPTKEETFLILKGVKHHFEDFHHVSISDTLLKYITDLSARYLLNKKNPDKAIDIIDETGASLKLNKSLKKRIHLSKKMIDQTLSKMAKIPKPHLEKSQGLKFKEMTNKLKLLIYGQDHALTILADAIVMSRSGLGNVDRPIGNFLFTGPTGVGKTELAKQLSLYLDGHLEQIDMSEYMEKHAISKLIGAPPGYIGYDQGGLLTDTIKKYPHSVILLDEIEKAHPDIFNILLQIMEHGHLTDSQGRKTDFRHSILIMTSNLGAQEMESGHIGLSSHSQNNQGTLKVIKKFFNPEFRNRLDAIVQFRSLPHEQIYKIVEKFLFELEVKLKSKNVEMKVSVSVKNWLVKNGFDSKMGARPIRRLIDKEIKIILSREILFGQLKKGGKVFLDLDPSDQRLEFSY